MSSSGPLKNIPKSKKYSLIFAEPRNFNYKKNYMCLDVTKHIYNLIITQGATVHEDSDGMAYSFGEIYDIDEYEHPGWETFKKDGRSGQVGLLDLVGCRRKHINGYISSDFEEKYGHYHSNDLAYLRRIQETYPEIKWLGRASPGSKNAHLHFHVDEKDHIDSIIIDMGYFYNADIVGDSTSEESNNSDSNSNSNSDYDSDCSCEDCRRKKI